MKIRRAGMIVAALMLSCTQQYQPEHACMDTELIIIENFQQYNKNNPYAIRGGFNGLIVSPLSFMSQAVVRSSRGQEYRLSRHLPVPISSAHGAVIWPALPFRKSLGGGNWTRWAVDSLILTTFPARECLYEKMQLHRPYKDIISAYYDEDGADAALMNDFSIPIQEFTYVNILVEPETSSDFFTVPSDWQIRVLLDNELVLDSTFSSNNMTSHRLDARGKNTVRVLVNYNGGSNVPNTHVIVTGG